MSVKAQPVHGADISKWQGEVTAEEIKAAKLHWLYAKATEGVSVIDTRYKAHRAAAKAAGVPFGGYHFAHPSSDARKSALKFLEIATPQPGDMRPMLDFEHNGFKEWTVAKRSAWVKTWVDIVRKATGQDPILYCTMDLNSHFGCALWTARYNDDNRAPNVPAPWKTWTIWQFSDGQSGTPKRVAGLGNVDLNVMNGDPVRLTKIFQLPKPEPVKPAPKPTAPPVVKPPAPAPRKSVTVRVGTANIQNFPDMTDTNVRNDVREVLGLTDLVLWQEIAEAGDHKAINDLDTAFSTTLVKVETPITARTSLLKPKGAPRVTKIAEGLGKGMFSPDRYMTVQEYTWAFPTTLPNVVVINIHYVQAAWSGRDVPLVPLRQERWGIAHGNHKNAALEFLERGYIVIGGGDWNRRMVDIPKFTKDQKWIVGGSGIDHVYILTPRGVRAESTPRVTTDLHSDHSLRATRLTLLGS